MSNNEAITVLIRRLVENGTPAMEAWQVMSRLVMESREPTAEEWAMGEPKQKSPGD